MICLGLPFDEIRKSVLEMEEGMVFLLLEEASG